ncbi:MAG: cytochrome d ubiquinol oxidase subunit II [Planctomycetota bacterium]
MIGVDLFWWIMGTGLIIYVMTGGADYGGGVWDLLARGKEQARERRMIEAAIGPIWEVNHIWVIFIIVTMFSVFPKAFAAICIALHIPISLVVVGMILRGACFTFRGYGLQPGATAKRWGMIFAWASLITPIFLGMTLAATSSGEIRLVDGEVTSGYFSGWLSPFAVCTGVLTLVIFSLTAAVYLLHEVEPDMVQRFRDRAFKAQIVVLVLLAIVYGLAHRDAPIFAEQLDNSALIWPLRFFIVLAVGAVFWSLKNKHDDLARMAVVAQVAGVVLGWGLAMDRYLVIPDLTIDNAGAHQETLEAMAPVFIAGAVLLVPALFMLFRVFKSKSKEA